MTRRSDEPEAISAVLTDLVGPVDDLGELGAGAWSRAWSFRCGEADLVARFGLHHDDFEADAEAARFAAAYRAELPVPETLVVAPAFDGWVSVTRRCHGTFCEELDADGWRLLTPALIAALRALWSIDPQQLPATARERFAVDTGWTDRLAEIGEEKPGRLGSWSQRLSDHPGGRDSFDRGWARLRGLLAGDGLTSVRPRLVHADLINRNALVADDRFTGIIDWGCCVVRDPLYELAWFDFWAPWHPGLAGLDLAAVTAATLDADDLPPEHRDDRWRACAIHIGLDHLAYNAMTGDAEALTRTMTRLEHYL